MQRFFLLLLTVLFQINNTDAQIKTNSYVFKSSNSVYTDLAGDISLTQLIFGTNNEFVVSELNGNKFNLFGESWTMDGVSKSILIFPNGLVEAVDAGGDIMVFNGLLRKLDSIDNTSKISYKIEGNLGSKILKVQWKNVSVESGQIGNFVNLQVWVYQDGIVEYRYGPSSANNVSGYNTSTGPSVGVFYSPADVSQIYQKLMVHGMPSSFQLDSSKTISFPNILGVPTNGTVYRFVPKALSISLKTAKEKSMLKVFPNPANEMLNVFIDETTNNNAGISLYTADGKLLKEYILSPNKNNINIQLTDVPAGIYTLQCTLGSTVLNKAVEIVH